MSRLTVEVKASDGHSEVFDAPYFEIWIRANEAGFVYVMVSDKEGREKVLAAFFRPICAKFVEVNGAKP